MAVILPMMIAIIATIPPVLVQKESLMACPVAGVLVAEAEVVVDAPPIDAEGGILVGLLVVIVVEAIFKVEVENGAIFVSVVGILIWIGNASTFIPIGLIGLTVVPIAVVFWSKTLSKSKYVVVLKYIGLWQKQKYGEFVHLAVFWEQP